MRVRHVQIPQDRGRRTISRSLFAPGDSFPQCGGTIRGCHSAAAIQSPARAVWSAKEDTLRWVLTRAAGSVGAHRQTSKVQLRDGRAVMVPPLLTNALPHATI